MIVASVVSPGALLPNECVLAAVVAKCRAGIAARKTGQMAVVHDGPGVTGPGKAGDLEPGRPAALLAALGSALPRRWDGIAIASLTCGNYDR
jgi:hypothetical protein